jgi:hypothetical protein
MSLPFQPRERVGETLSAADVHVVTMGNDLVGIVHPCKIYGALAVGRPILFVGPEMSHAGEILAGAQFGQSVRHGDVAGAVSAIRSWMAVGEEGLTALGREGAVLAAVQYARRPALSRICDILEK